MAYSKMILCVFSMFLFVSQISAFGFPKSIFKLSPRSLLGLEDEAEAHAPAAFKKAEKFFSHGRHAIQEAAQHQGHARSLNEFSGFKSNFGLAGVQKAVEQIKEADKQSQQHEQARRLGGAFYNGHASFAEKIKKAAKHNRNLLGVESKAHHNGFFGGLRSPVHAAGDNMKKAKQAFENMMHSRKQN